MADANEEALSRRAAAGDHDALEELLDRHGRQLSGTLNISPRWRSVLEPADVLQVTYLEAFLRIGEFAHDGPGSFGRWLRRIAENNLRDAIKELSRAKRPQPQRRVEVVTDASYVDLLAQLGADTTSPSMVAARREAIDLLQANIPKLPPDYQTVIRLYALEGRPAEELAAQMGRSIGAIYLLRMRALERLRGLLGTRSMFLSGSS